MIDVRGLFMAELKREFILLRRYPFETISRLVWNLGFALLIYFGFNAIGGSAAQSIPGFSQGQDGRLLGLLTTYIAMNALNNAAEVLQEETRTGTLEQAALSPPPLVMVLFMRDLASLIEMLVRFVLVVALASLVTGVRFHLDPLAIGLLLTLMYLGLEGLGMILGGAALLYKRIATLSQFAVMLVFGLAMLPLSTQGVSGLLVQSFPFTKALLLLRAVAVDGKPFSALVADGSLLSLALNAALFLALGAAVFTWAEARARDWGTLNQY